MCYKAQSVKKRTIYRVQKRKNYEDFICCVSKASGKTKYFIVFLFPVKKGEK